MSLDCVPEAEQRVWHRVNGVAMTRSVVTGEPILTQCGKKLSTFNLTSDGSKGRGESLPRCPVCWAIKEHQDAMREEWSNGMNHSRTLF